MTFDVLWYLVVIAALIFYAMLDGFDLGVGCLHLFARNDSERRIFLNAIGPVWDGNEVWLVIVVGALFAGFPEAFATIFSSFYVFTILLLFGLIFRAVSIEFRSKHPSHRWRRSWDLSFSLASIAIAFGTGLVLGNLIQGIPLDPQKDFIGSWTGFIRPYPILFGISTIALCSMHGSTYLLMKTEGDLHNYLKKWVVRCTQAFLSCYFILTLATFYFAPHMIERLKKYPILFLIPLIGVLLVLNIPREVSKNRNGRGFISSALSIAAFLSLFPIGTFPILVRSNLNPAEHSLMITNAASSEMTLKILLLIVLIGLPLVFAYGAYVYHIFRGKVHLEDHSY